MAPEFREEHRQALSFLNTLGGESARFFGVEISVVRIGDSAPAPLFKLAAEPNELHSRAATAVRMSQERSGKRALYEPFWQRFLERVRAERPWFSTRSPFKEMNEYVFSFAAHGRLRCELYVDSTDPERVSSLYEHLAAHKQDIEGAFGEPLEWEASPGRRARRIAVYTDGDIAALDDHDRYIAWFVETGTRLRAALNPFAPTFQLGQPA